MNIPAYAEIGITTNFSFLRGGSHPQDYVQQASALHLPAIGIADHFVHSGPIVSIAERSGTTEYDADANADEALPVAVAQAVEASPRVYAPA